MSERPPFGFSLPALAGLLFAAAAFSAACSNAPLGECVTVYSYGASKAVASTQSDCETGCPDKMEATPGLISGCYFQGVLVNPVEPGN
ncbi:MAG TPA: hypothetical protein VLV16_14190 [Gemmatimonadales bacterium]|nr:hypothetical protein [Gemmatimonadales bacterium]